MPAPLKGKLVRALLSLPAPILRRMGGAVEVDGQQLEPGLAVLCRVLASRLDYPSMGVEAARRHMESTTGLLGAPRPSDVVTEDFRIGPHQIKARRYSAQTGGPGSPCVLYFHGGGWVLGSLESHDLLCAYVASRLKGTVLAVDYRLAPEHPFPAAVEDALSAFDELVERSSSWGHDPEEIVVAGDSAGANLAAVISRLISDRAEGPRPKAQWLIYPVIHGRRDTESFRLFEQGFGLSRRMVDWFYDCYCTPQELDDPRVAPILGSDLSRLPPTVLAIAGFDVLRDEGLEYAEALRRAGVQVTCDVFPHLTHSFARMTGLPACRRALDQSLASLATVIE